MKCPCCKVVNSLDECLKHPSQTSAQAGLRAWQSFVEMDKEKLLLAIYPCPKHGTEGGYINFINEANAKKREITDHAKEARARLAAQNINDMFRDAAMRLLGVARS